MTRQRSPSILCLALALTACGGSSSPTPPPATNAINGCASSDFVGGSSVSFTFTAYTPRCLTIAAGQTVTFSGDFSSHPLSPGVAPTSTGTSSPSNPIAATSSGTSAAFKFPTAGTYAYFCGVHFGSGMFGAVRVQ